VIGVRFRKTAYLPEGENAAAQQKTVYTAQTPQRENASMSATEHALRFQRQAAELMLASPQVVAHRLMRMATTFGPPSAADRKEMQLMGTEKMSAFTESWNAMALETIRLQQHYALSFMQSYVAPWAFAKRNAPAPTMMNAAERWRESTLSVANKGLAPVHRRAVANAKRLRKAK
jgi:hypothetical protein